MPVELVENIYLSSALQDLERKENRLAEISAEYEEMIDFFSEEEKSPVILNDANNAFVKTEITKVCKEMYANVETEKIRALKAYILLLDNKAKKTEKEAYIKAHADIAWDSMIANKDGTYAKVKVTKYILALQFEFAFPKDSYESKIVRVQGLLSTETALKKELKVQRVQCKKLQSLLSRPLPSAC